MARREIVHQNRPGPAGPRLEHLVDRDPAQPATGSEVFQPVPLIQEYAFI